MTWRAREAGADDTDRLALVGAATFLETFAGVLDGSAIVTHCQREHSPSAYASYLERGARAWIGETEPGQVPVGFALLAKADLSGSAEDDSDLELKRIYVLSRFHGTGLGAELMQQVVGAAKGGGAQRLLLGVYARNERALAFYRKSGFVQIAARRFRVGDREYDDVVLAKLLA